jgi:HSP20 family molecular chaperone IbpA
MGNNNAALTRSGSRALMRQPEVHEIVVTPVADVYETSDAFIAKLDMPGVDRDQISVSVEPGRLLVKGVMAVMHQVPANIIFCEIGTRSYVREINLGDGIRYDQIQAVFEDGVLTITLPKTDEVKARHIPIK